VERKRSLYHASGPGLLAGAAVAELSRRFTMCDWVNYWDKQDDADEKIRGINMDLFEKKTRDILNFGPGDIVMDLGCGTGLLADRIKTKVEKVYCLDTSERYVNLCAEKFKNDKNVHVYKLKDDYIDLSFLNDKFTKIICLSVLQYYKSIEEITELVKNIKAISGPNLTILIADMPTHGSPVGDIFGNLSLAAKYKYLWAYIKFLWKSITGNYAAVRNKVGLLSLTDADLEHLAKSTDAQIRKIDRIITVNKNRAHFLLQFGNK
jgi:ubiquinone/menaquinone biosynthesis C-methylase UbiE